MLIIRRKLDWKSSSEHQSERVLLIFQCILILANE